MQTLTELEFIRKCAAGDAQSREEFISKYSRLIYKYILHVVDKCGEHGAVHAEDIFQDIICRLFEKEAHKLRSFEGKNGCSFPSWLRQVTVNFTLRYLSSIQPSFSLDEVQGENDDNPLAVLVDGAAGVVDTLQVRERMSGLQECISSLDDDGRYFVELHINRGVCLEDIKNHLGMTRNAMDVYKSRLINRLRECFKKKGFFIE